MRNRDARGSSWRRELAGPSPDAARGLRGVDVSPPAAALRRPGPHARAPRRAMIHGQRRLHARRLGRGALGERLGGFIYGTIVVLSVIVAGAKSYPDAAGSIAVLAVVTVAVFWLAHVYAHALGQSIAHDRHLELVEVRRIARHEASMLEAAVPPVAILVAGAVGIVSRQTAIWGALALGLVVLVAQGITFARIERLGPLATLGVVGANLALGVLLVALKLVIAH